MTKKGLNMVARPTRKAAAVDGDLRGPGGAVQPPYTPDHQSPGFRLSRLLIAVGLGVFCLLYGSAFALFGQYVILLLSGPIIVLAMVVIWALPEARTAPTGVLVALMFAFVFLLVMWPNYIALALPGLPWITMIRLTGFPLTFVLLICLSTSKSFREGLVQALVPTPFIWISYLLFLVIALLSIGLSAHMVQSLDKFLIVQVSWTAVMFASAFMFLRPGRVEQMAVLLWVMAIAVGLIALAESRAQHVLWAGHIPSFLQINDPSVQSSLAGGDRFGKYRAQSTFGTPLGLGEYMAITLPFVLRFATGAYRTWVRVAAWASCMFIVFVAIISGARVGTIGCLLSMTIYLAVWAALKWRRDPQSLVGPAVTLGFPAIALLVGGGVMFIGRLRTLFWGDGSERYSTDARVAQMTLGLPKVLSHPQGYGIGMGAEALAYHPPGGKLSIDNYYLDVALEYGVVGFVIFYGMLAAAIYYCASTMANYRARSRDFDFLTTIAIALLTFVIIKSSFSEQDNHPLIFMMLGMVMALCARARADASASAHTAAASSRTSIHAVDSRFRPRGGG